MSPPAKSRVENTRAQRKAADPLASVWVAASAGTGKTKVLTDRILSLLLADTPPERILALTFTKAAAGEMANRLARKLGDWSTLSNADLGWEVKNITGHAATKDEKLIARRLFARVLDVPGGMRIQTIHAFCEALLKRFPLEARVIPHFAVLDERDAAELLSECRANVLQRAQDDGKSPLAAALAVISGHLNEDQFTGVIGNLIGERARIGALTVLHGGTDAVIAKVHKTLDVPPGASPEAVVAEACQDGAFDGAELRRTAEAMAQGAQTDQTNGTLILDWLNAGATRARLFDAYLSVFLTAKGERRKSLILKKASELFPEGAGILEAEYARIAKVLNRQRAALTAEATAALLVLGDEVLRAYEQGKRLRAALDYDDLILKTRDLLRSDGGAGWVHFKLDGGIEHVLVDEAQDTNPEQWEVIRALTGEFFTGASAHEGTRTIFAVGDPKQSIYRFQRADPKSFLDERDHYSANVTNSNGTFAPVPLDTSFRTTAAVLKVVDDLFSADTPRKGLLHEARTLRHGVHRKNLAGRVEVWPAAFYPEASEERGWTVPVTTSTEISPRQRVATRIAETVETWLQSGEMLESEGRPMRAGDILVLVPRRSPFVDELVRQLKQRGVPVAGADRMVLTDQLAVMDLIALGRFLLLPDDELNFAALLKSPLCGLDDDDLMAFVLGRDKTPLWRAFRDAAEGHRKFGPVLAMLEALRRVADFERPYDLFARVLTAPEFAGRRRILARLGPDAEDPVDEFLSLALAYEQGHVPSLEGFLHWIESGDAQIKRDLEQGDRDEIRIMTVHGAKGLEAPVVFLPDTFLKPVRGNTRDALLWPEGKDILLWPPRREHEEAISEAARAQADELERAENWRRLYVAMTRAAERLYVCGFLTRKDKRGDEGWLSAARLDDTWYNAIAETLQASGTPVSFETPDDGAVWAAPWGDGALRYEVPQGEAAATPGSDARADEPLPLEPWATTIPHPEKDPPRPLAPSRPDLPDPPVRSPLIALDDEERPAVTGTPPPPDDPFRRGNLIHRMLELLPALDPGQRNAAGEKYLARAAADIPADVRTAWIEESLAVIDEPAFAAAFAPGSRAEVPLTGLAGGRVISGQIDRLAVDGNRVLVVDYKTNRPPPQNAEDVPPVYLAQMAAYRALLGRIYVDHEIDCALLWTDGPRLMHLEASQLDRHMP